MSINLDGAGVGQQERRRFGPPWLDQLLRESFWHPCHVHPGRPRNERNFFCLDCANSRSLCWRCLSGHRQHHVLQIRRSSYHDVVRATELGAVVDISLVQTYALNADRVVFLNSRPQAPNHSVKCIGAAGGCVTCGRGLVDGVFRFCCVACKVEEVAKDPNLTMGVDQKRRRDPPGGPDSDDDVAGPSKLQRPGQISFRKRARKGVPERAPFF